jgi:hypothetical protein
MALTRMGTVRDAGCAELQNDHYLDGYRIELLEMPET